MKSGVTFDSGVARFILCTQGAEDSWDLSDSLADLYLEHDIISKKSWSSMTTFKPPSNLDDIDRDKWISADTSHGFVTCLSYRSIPSCIIYSIV